MKKSVKKKEINWRNLFLCLVIVYSVALIGSLFTDIGPWYDSVRPSITPPSYVFPVVWNILFFLIALSLYFAWENSKEKDKKKIILFYGINFALNILWSVFYFGMQKPAYAFVEIFFLWASILWLVIFTYKIEKNSSYLLIPYLLWVSFAALLNYLSI